MLKKRYFYVSMFSLFVSLTSCKTIKNTNLIQENFAFAEKQLNHSFSFIEKAQAEYAPNPKKQEIPVSPRNIEPDGSLRLVASRDWTSGFFPGSLWYMYEYTGGDFWKMKAQEFTANIEQEKLNDRTHDMGFKMYCSFGNGYRLTNNENFKNILIESASTLITRYKPNAKIIRSWDHNKDKWDCPVIIDNLMNLELLFWASKVTGDKEYYDIAVNHAKTTIKNHFRPDYSTWHVVDYDTITGSVRKKNTHQGYSHESTWSRGEAWALYGYTMAYRETGIEAFLNQAVNIAEFIFNHPRLPKDLIPFWDFDAPGIPNEPRDV